MSDTPESDKAMCRFTSLFANEDAYWVHLAVARKLERERDKLKKALRLAGKLCHEVSHPKAMQHDYATDCPVEALIQKALQ